MLKLEVTLNDINYSRAVLEFLPKILGDLVEKNEKIRDIYTLLQKHGVDINGIVVSILNNFTKEQMDGLVLDGVNKYSNEIIELLNSLLLKQNIQITLDNVKMEQV